MRKYLPLFFLLAIAQNAWAKDSFNVCWSHYVGWEPWAYIEASGAMARWGDKYGIEVNIKRVDDYVDSLERFSSGEFDACTMTQMDALAFPATKGVDTSVLIIGDYSNGNDGILSRDAGSVIDLKGQDILLVQYSVSHYLLARALKRAGLSEADVNLVSVSDAEILDVFRSGKAPTLVTWNPILKKAQTETKAKLIFDSSELQGEILDLMVTRTDTDERLKRALTGAWYETMERLRNEDMSVVSSMAESAGASRVSILQQLASTKMLYSPRRGVKVANSKSTLNAMDRVRQFCFEHGLLGDITNLDDIGISFPDGSVLGDSKNIRFRIDSRYMQMAAENRL
ncbi:alkanesulfonate transporter substrate-binding subunit [Grimontia celer]|uniref:Alkanesulfonate transporter substrate-binding subunit n=1 Tax=Grimontia celer TaxID=1796497 RepID=A0A128ETH7_9GAMM|nr:putative urea ABC transporter substrate-binding protein [Grimontia celer]CZF77877.1 alkanesulfonate transporter substrate-binding subunit [Grimontia celer]